MFSATSRPGQRILVAYLIVWMFEGAARKWLLPALQQPLYFSRVVVVVFAVVYATSRLRRPWPAGAHLAVFYVMFIAVFTATHVAIGAQTITQAVLGSRLWIEIVLMPLAMAALVDARDTVVVGRLAVGLSFPVGLLSLVQVASPPTSWVNKLLADDGSDNFTNVGGVVRATSVFTSSAGHAVFIIFAVGCAAALVVSPLATERDRRLAMISLPMLLVMAVTSGSRSALFGVGIVMCASLIGMLSWRTQGTWRMLAGIVTAGTLGLWAAPRVAPAAFAGIQARLSGDGATVEPTGRVVGGLVEWLYFLPDAPASGLGLGATAQGLGVAAAQRGTEGEYGQWMLQLGPALFVVFFVLRWLAFGYLVRRAIVALREGRTHALPFLATALVGINGAATSQGSVNGFTVLAIVLLIGATRPSRGDWSPRRVDVGSGGVTRPAGRKRSVIIV